ncbi:hypothetical protein C0J52_01061 [Blattella germanica]|nr:hypothetical protein C0J52_01061 [Blattella germanica]
MKNCHELPFPHLFFTLEAHSCAHRMFRTYISFALVTYLFLHSAFRMLTQEASLLFIFCGGSTTLESGVLIILEDLIFEVYHNPCMKINTEKKVKNKTLKVGVQQTPLKLSRVKGDCSEDFESEIAI